jgi:hypothetical protein
MEIYIILLIRFVKMCSKRVTIAWTVNYIYIYIYIYTHTYILPLLTTHSFSQDVYKIHR